AAAKVDPLGRKADIAIVGKPELAVDGQAAQRRGRDVEHHVHISRDGDLVTRRGYAPVRPGRGIGPAHLAHGRSWRLHRGLRRRVDVGMILSDGDSTGAHQERYGKKTRIKPGLAHDRHPPRANECPPYECSQQSALVTPLFQEHKRPQGVPKLYFFVSMPPSWLW